MDIEHSFFALLDACAGSLSITPFFFFFDTGTTFAAHCTGGKGNLSGRKRRRRGGVLRRSNVRRRANKRRKAELRNDGGLFVAVDRPLLNLIAAQLSGKDALRLACCSRRCMGAVDAVRPLPDVRAEAEDEHDAEEEEARQRRMDAAVVDFLATNGKVAGASYQRVAYRHGFKPNELREGVARELNLRAGLDSDGNPYSDSD